MLALLKNYEGEKSGKIKITVIRLIEEMDMRQPHDLYIDAIAAASEESDFTEVCAKELKDSGETQLDSILAAYEHADNPYAADCFLDILTDLPYDERTYHFALDRFLYGDTGKAFYASCLGKIGNEDAIPYLEGALKEEDIPYFDYVSIKNALEELGGEISIERDFTGDKDYESLKNIGE